MLSKYIEIIEKELKNCFDDSRFFIHQEIKEAMAYTTLLPSKKLRAIFALETCKIFSGSYENALGLALGIEMLHSQSLIHDDLPSMDNDDLRRGKPANHKVFGEATAILAGDALISFGAQTILEKTPENVDKETLCKVLNKYLTAAGAFGIVGGQIADINAENKKITQEELNFIHKYKTSALFELAIIGGAMLGGASNQETRDIEKFAKAFGLAFQIRDDILDVISNEEELGKTIGKDAKANKSTYVTFWGLDTAKEKLLNLLKECYDIMSFMGIKSEIYTDILKKMEIRKWHLTFLTQVTKQYFQAF